MKKTFISLAAFIYWISGVAIVLMMLITCADVVLRYFRRPIPGTYELVCFLGSVAVSFAMARTTLEKGHVAVNLLVRYLSTRVQSLISILTTMLAFILFAVLSWQGALFANDLRIAREVSLTLGLPFYPFVYGMSFSSATVCLILLVVLSEHLKGVLGE